MDSVTIVEDGVPLLNPFAGGLNQPQVSKHLKVLASAMLVSVRADGRHRHYRLDGVGLQAAHDWFASFDDVWHARFDALDELVSTDPETPLT